ncbi:MAG: HmuY family protein [Chitinophagaceae bacterium]
MKKTATKIMMGALFVMLTVSSCKKDDTASVDTTNNGTFKVFTQGSITTVQNLPGDTIVGIDPVSGQPYGSGKFKFFSIETGQLIANTDSATTKWDIAFRGTTILTNSGTSGPGAGGAYVQVGLFADVAAVSTDSTFRTDAAPVYAIRTGSNKGWYVYDGANNLITPIPGRVLMIRTASGKYAKMEITNYYKGGTTPATTAPDAIKLGEQRYFNFRYTYQANGSMTF